MNKKLAMISTGAGLIPLLTEITNRIAPALQITHFLHDGIIRSILENENRIPENCFNQLLLIAKAAEMSGADAILLTCSSVSGFVDFAAPQLKIPVFKIDRPMLEKALQTGTTIGVIATLKTTIQPTTEQLTALAKEKGVEPVIHTRLCGEAYDALGRGDTETHHGLIAACAEELCMICDVVVLAQASMAAAAETLPENCGDKVLCSPYLGIAAAADYLLKQ